MVQTGPTQIAPLLKSKHDPNRTISPYSLLGVDLTQLELYRIVHTIQIVNFYSDAI